MKKSALILPRLTNIAKCAPLGARLKIGSTWCRVCRTAAARTLRGRHIHTLVADGVRCYHTPRSSPPLWRPRLLHPPFPSLPATPRLSYCHFHPAPASPAALHPSPLLFTSSSLAAGRLLAVALVLLLFHVLFAIHASTPRLFAPVTSGVSSSGLCSIDRHLDPHFETMQWQSKHAVAKCGTVLYSAFREGKRPAPWKGGEQQTMRRRWGGDVATDTPRKPGRQIDILGSSLPSVYSPDKKDQMIR